MGIYIDKHFYSDLFLEKKVNWFNDIYLSLFNTIWPRSKNFELFLTSSDTSLKIEYAKKIYQDFSLVNDIFLPSFTVFNVLEDQYLNLKNSSDGYTPQDHVIHSIHLYILGIYLFFNSDKINKRFLLFEKQLKQYDIIKFFVIKWQVFSLYHDVGYFFENGDFDKNKLSAYININNDLLKTLISKNITRTYSFKFLAEKNHLLFEEAILNDNYGPWFDNNGKPAQKKQLTDEIHQFVGAVCLDKITNDEELGQLLPLLDNKKNIVVVENEYGKCIMLIIRDHYRVQKVFSKSFSLYDDLLIGNKINNSNKKYSYKYYLIGLKDDSLWKKAIDESLAISDILSQLPNDVKSDISINSNCFVDVLFIMNDWIISEIVDDKDQEQKKFKNNYYNCLYESYINTISGFFTETMKDPRIDLSFIEKSLIAQASMIKEKRKKLISTIQNNATELYEKHYATTHMFIDFFTEKYDQLSNELSLQKNQSMLQFIDVSDTTTKIYPFEYNKDNSDHVKLYNHISNLCQFLGTTIDILKNYHSPYVMFDHGVISAALLFQSVCICLDLKKFCKENYELSLAWNSFYSDEEYLKTCSEIIFSVLIHNIYNKKSTPEYGIEYMHDIEKNPFSYFCAFCDTIQKWGRPKKINLAQANLPKNSYLEDEFDIDISSGRIIISCIKENITKTYETIQSSEAFLPGISKLVEIKEF